jgi:hypothetical protein
MAGYWKGLCPAVDCDRLMMMINTSSSNTSGSGWLCVDVSEFCGRRIPLTIRWAARSYAIVGIKKINNQLRGNGLPPLFKRENLIGYYQTTCIYKVILFFLLVKPMNNKYGSVTALKQWPNIYVLEGGASNQISASLVRNFSWNQTSTSYVNSFKF